MMMYYDDRYNSFDFIAAIILSDLFCLLVSKLEMLRFNLKFLWTYCINLKPEKFWWWSELNWPQDQPTAPKNQPR
jgi:hypothetical protein